MRWSSVRESALGSIRTPPLAPPNGRPISAHFQRHPDRQRRDLAQVHVVVVADAALGGAHGEHVLHAVAVDRVDGLVVVAPERERNHQRALRRAQALPDVVVEVHQLRRLVELRDGQAVHRRVPFEHRFGHARERSASSAARRKSSGSARSSAPQADLLDRLVHEHRPARPGCGSRARAPRAGGASRAGDRPCRRRVAPARSDSAGAGVASTSGDMPTDVAFTSRSHGSSSEPTRAPSSAASRSARARVRFTTATSSAEPRAARTRPRAPRRRRRAPWRACRPTARAARARARRRSSRCCRPRARRRARSACSPRRSRARPSLTRSASAQRRLLVRERDAELRQAARAQRGERGLELAGRDVEDLEARVEPERAIGGGVHHGRERVPGRVQHDPAERADSPLRRPRVGVEQPIVSVAESTSQLAACRGRAEREARLVAAAP